MTNQGPACMHVGVGIDTARYGHHVSLLDEQKRTAGHEPLIRIRTVPPNWNP